MGKKALDQLDDTQEEKAERKARHDSKSRKNKDYERKYDDDTDSQDEE